MWALLFTLALGAAAPTQMSSAAPADTCLNRPPERPDEASADPGPSIIEEWLQTGDLPVLGSGIAFHGWRGAWNDEDPWLNWGCLVMHNDDIASLYPLMVPVTVAILLWRTTTLSSLLCKLIDIFYAEIGANKHLKT